MKKLFLVLLFIVCWWMSLEAQPTIYTANLPLFSYATSIATTSLWTVPPSSGSAATQYIDTTTFLRSNIVNLQDCDSVQLYSFSNDTICAKIYVWRTDGINYADSATTIVDSIKIASSSGGNTMATWKKINAALLGSNVVGNVYEQPYKIRFTTVFYTSGTGGATGHSAHKSRYQSVWQRIKFFRH